MLFSWKVPDTYKNLRSLDPFRLHFTTRRFYRFFIFGRIPF